MTWDDIRLFLGIIRHGSVTEAAAALKLSHSTLARRLRRLEVACGTALFERLPNRLQPTAAGRELAAAAQEMHEGAHAVMTRARARRRGDSAVRVSATFSVSLFLSTHAGELAEAIAAAGGELSILPTRAPLDLTVGDADLALRMKRAPERGRLATRRIGRVAFSLYAARRLWNGKRAAGTWSGIAVIGLPQTARRPSQSRWVDDQAARQGAAIRLRLGEVPLRHRAVRDALGIGLLPCFLGDADPDLVRVLSPPAELIEDVHLLLHEETRRIAAVRAAADAIRALFRREKRALLGLIGAR